MQISSTTRVVGLAVAATIPLTLLPAVLPRSAGEQGVATGFLTGIAGAGALVAATATSLIKHRGATGASVQASAPLLAGVAAATATAALGVALLADARQSPGDGSWDGTSAALTRTMVALGVGAGVGVGLAGGARLATSLLRGGRTRGAIATAGAALTTLLGIGAAGAVTRTLVMRNLGSANEHASGAGRSNPAYAPMPAPAEATSQASTFLGKRSSPTAIAELRTPSLNDGTTRTPIRVYVESKSTSTEIPDLADTVAAIESSGAFERGTIHIAIPTASGGVSGVEAAAPEHLLNGDVATVAARWDDSSFAARSHRSIAAAADFYAQLLDRIDKRSRELGRPAPKVLVTGYSLAGDVALATLDRLSRSDLRLAKRIDWVTLGITHQGAAQLHEVLQSHPELDDRVTTVSNPDDPIATADAQRIIAPVGPDPHTGLPWIPIVSGALEAVDLAAANRQYGNGPSTSGHDYRTRVTHVLAGVIAPGIDSNYVGHVRDSLLELEPSA